MSIFFLSMLNAFRHQRLRAGKVMLVPAALRHLKVLNLEIMKMLNAFRHLRIQINQAIVDNYNRKTTL